VHGWHGRRRRHNDSEALVDRCCRANLRLALSRLVRALACACCVSWAVSFVGLRPAGRPYGQWIGRLIGQSWFRGMDGSATTDRIPRSPAQLRCRSKPGLARMVGPERVRCRAGREFSVGKRFERNDFAGRRLRCAAMFCAVLTRRLRATPWSRAGTALYSVPPMAPCGVSRRTRSAGSHGYRGRCLAAAASSAARPSAAATTIVCAHSSLTHACMPARGSIVCAHGAACVCERSDPWLAKRCGLPHRASHVRTEPSQSAHFYYFVCGCY
jgi:hypothetical protein